MRKVRPSRIFGRKKQLGKFEIAKLELRPGDTLVLRTELHLTREQVEQLRSSAERQFPGVKVAILTSGLSLAVLSKVAA